MLKKLEFRLRKNARNTEEALAILNREMVVKMISLAGKTGEVEPLIEAVQNMARTNELHTISNTDVSHAELQKGLADTLYKLARAEQHQEALNHAIIAYRGTITIASMLGETKLRTAAKRNCTLAIKLNASWKADASASRAA